MDSSKIGLEVIATSNMIRRYVEKNVVSEKSGKNLSGINGLMINFLYENRDKELCQKDIENYFSLRPSTVSTDLSLMEKKGFIKRETMSHDTRHKKVTLTKKSIAFEEKNTGVKKIIADKFNKALTKEEQKLFLQLTDKIKNEFK